MRWPRREELHEGGAFVRAAARRSRAAPRPRGQPPGLAGGTACTSSAAAPARSRRPSVDRGARFDLRRRALLPRRATPPAVARHARRDGTARAAGPPVAPACRRRRPPRIVRIARCCARSPCVVLDARDVVLALQLNLRSRRRTPALSIIARKSRTLLLVFFSDRAGRSRKFRCRRAKDPCFAGGRSTAGRSPAVGSGRYR